MERNFVLIDPVTGKAIDQNSWPAVFRVARRNPRLAIIQVGDPRLAYSIPDGCYKAENIAESERPDLPPAPDEMHEILCMVSAAKALGLPSVELGGYGMGADALCDFLAEQGGKRRKTLYSDQKGIYVIESVTLEIDGVEIRHQWSGRDATEEELEEFHAAKTQGKSHTGGSTYEAATLNQSAR